MSTSKRVIMIFRKRNKEPMEIILRNQIIPCKQSTQFLGMTLDSRLNLDEHIDRVKAERALKTIKVVAGKKKGKYQRTLKRLYSAVCRSKVDYGCHLNCTS